MLDKMFLILEIISYSWVSCIYVPHINKDKMDFKDNEIIKLHYKESLEETISDRKINSVLKMLEDDLRVIEFVDGYLVVKDKIYFE